MESWNNDCRWISPSRWIVLWEPGGLHDRRRLVCLFPSNVTAVDLCGRYANRWWITDELAVALAVPTYVPLMPPWKVRQGWSISYLQHNYVESRYLCSSRGMVTEPGMLTMKVRDSWRLMLHTIQRVHRFMVLMEVDVTWCLLRHRFLWWSRHVHLQLPGH